MKINSNFVSTLSLMMKTTSVLMSKVSGKLLLKEREIAATVKKTNIYTNQYNRFLTSNNINPTNYTWIKELTLNKIILYTRDAELASSRTVFCSW